MKSAAQRCSSQISPFQTYNNNTNEQNLFQTPKKIKNHSVLQQTNDTKKSYNQNVQILNLNKTENLLIKKKVNNNIYVPQIYNSQNKFSHQSPFKKNCFQRLRKILSIQELKILHQKNGNFRYRTTARKSKDTNQSKSKSKQKLKLSRHFQERQIQMPMEQKKKGISNYSQQNKGTNFTSAKSFMSKKFSKTKNISNRLPVNIFALSSTISPKKVNLGDQSRIFQNNNDLSFHQL